MTASEAAPGGRRRRFGGLLRQRNFRLFWIGETVNQLGSAMALIGVPLLAVLFLHATTFEVGALAAGAYLPWLIIGLPAGACVDRLPPRPVMIACDAVSAALYASVPVAYAIGVAHPVSVMVETFGTENIGRAAITRLVGEHFDLRPGAFREELRLHRPIYQKTAAYGHFGREDHDFTWERTDKAQALREAAGL